MPKVSLVVAVYNLEKYIVECLESIINQTFKDVEIICVNDGSKDNSLGILEEYAKKDSRIKIITQINQGSGAARNTGLAAASGDYIQFLDGDDYFEPDMIEKLYNLAKSCNADISACSSRKVDDEGNITETRNPNSPINLLKLPFNKPFSYKDFPNDFFDLLGAVPWNKLYRRQMLLEYGLKFPKLTGPDDLTFVFMAQACAEKIIVIDDELINYRFNRPGSVFTYRANYASDIVRASVIVQDFLKKIGKFDYLETAYLNAFKSAIRWE
ncbi:glycosyltransferase, partial [bacterium]|nr:glycosyltransferase [bacterium]